MENHAALRTAHLQAEADTRTCAHTMCVQNRVLCAARCARRARVRRQFF